MAKCPKCLAQIDIKNLLGAETIECQNCHKILKIPKQRTAIQNTSTISSVTNDNAQSISQQSNVQKNDENNISLKSQFKKINYILTGILLFLAILISHILFAYTVKESTIFSWGLFLANLIWFLIPFGISFIFLFLLYRCA